MSDLRERIIHTADDVGVIVSDGPMMELEGEPEDLLRFARNLVAQDLKDNWPAGMAMTGISEELNQPIWKPYKDSDQWDRILREKNKQP
jgi:hypothetical protein